VGGVAPRAVVLQRASREPPAPGLIDTPRVCCHGVATLLQLGSTARLAARRQDALSASRRARLVPAARLVDGLLDALQPALELGDTIAPRLQPCQPALDQVARQRKAMHPCELTQVRQIRRLDTDLKPPASAAHRGYGHDPARVRVAHDGTGAVAPHLTPLATAERDAEPGAEIDGRAATRPCAGGIVLPVGCSCGAAWPVGGAWFPACGIDCALSIRRDAHDGVL
jgi:hypothetical protein